MSSSEKDKESREREKLLDTQTEEDPSNLRHKQSSRVRSSLSRESKKVKKKKKRKKENKETETRVAEWQNS